MSSGDLFNREGWLPNFSFMETTFPETGANCNTIQKKKKDGMEPMRNQFKKKKGHYDGGLSGRYAQCPRPL